MIKAVVFDLDGTLVFTNKANYLAYRRACEENGARIGLTEEQFDKAIVGRRWDEWLAEMTGVTDKTTLERIHELKKRVYPSMFAHLEPNVPLFELIEFFAGHPEINVKIAVATVSSQETTEAMLEKFGLKGKISLVLAQKDVSKPKPDPEIYVKIAQKLGVKPGECLVFEDSEVGERAAKGAGMHCVRINA